MRARRAVLPRPPDGRLHVGRSLLGTTTSYFHSQSCALPFPFSSTSHSPTPTTPFKRDQRDDVVCMIQVYRHVAARPLPAGLPTPVPIHVRASPSLLLTSPCPVPFRTPPGVIADV